MRENTAANSSIGIDDTGNRNKNSALDSRSKTEEMK